MTTVYSFDVFDTLITRKVALPHHIFLLTGKRIVEIFDWDLDPAYFAKARRLVEKQLMKEGDHKANLYRIYERLTSNLDIPQELAVQLAQIEIKTEEENLLPVNKNIELLKKIRRKANKILFVSDMYLGEEIIKKILTDHDIYMEGDKIYVSCDYGATKDDGKLFEIILNDLQINENELHHFGNSLKGEIRGAKKIGVSCTYLPDANLNRYEKILANAEDQFRINSYEIIEYSKMAAASRYSRLQRQNEISEIYDVAASVAAPILYKFVANVLANSRGKTVYFLARDGYILHKIAERINRKGEYDTDLKYLYISREVMILARISELSNNDYLEYLKAIYSMESVRQALKKLSVNESSIESLSLEDSVFEELVLNLEKHKLEKIFLDKKIHKDISENSKDRKKRLLAYLKSEGLLDKKGSIIVDVGWALTIQNLLSEVLGEQEATLPEGFYIGINETADSSIRRGKKHGYIWDLRKNNYSINAPRVIQLFEIICSAPHGQTVDYEIMDETVKPVFNDYETKYLIEWGLQDLEEGILNSLEYNLNFNGNINSSILDHDLLTQLLKKFWLYPTKDEVSAWGKYPYDISENGDSVIRLFEMKPFFQILKQAVKAGKLPSTKKDHWPQAHLYSMPPFEKKAIKVVLNFKHKLHSIKNNLYYRLKSVLKY